MKNANASSTLELQKGTVNYFVVWKLEPQTSAYDPITSMIEMHPTAMHSSLCPSNRVEILLEHHLQCSSFA